MVLASASPRRRDLLAQLGITPAAIRAADIDETPLTSERPREYCRRITLAKLAAIASGPGEIVLAADTTVACGRRILRKPADEDEAAAFLRLLSGRRHDVFTTIAVRDDRTTRSRDVVTKVRFKPLSNAEIAFYLATGDWRGKAGGYAIQGPAAAFVPWISGSYSAVVGLPLAQTATLLQAAGLPIWR